MLENGSPRPGLPLERYGSPAVHAGKENGNALLAEVRSAWPTRSYSAGDDPKALGAFVLRDWRIPASLVRYHTSRETARKRLAAQPFRSCSRPARANENVAGSSCCCQDADPDLRPQKPVQILMLPSVMIPIGGAGPRGLGAMARVVGARRGFPVPDENNFGS